MRSSSSSQAGYTSLTPSAHRPSLLSSLKVCGSYRVRFFLAFSVTALTTLALYYIYFSPSKSYFSPTSSELLLPSSAENNTGATPVDFPRYDPPFGTFDADHNVLVVLHIQKTGGSKFGRHVARDTVGFPSTCRRTAAPKRDDCRDRRGYYWLFSRVSTGWACGLHADWTELHECVPAMLNKLEKQKRDRRSVGVISFHFECRFTFANNPS